MIGKPEIVSEDARGYIAKIDLPDKRECILIFTRKGFARGGEYHNSEQTDTLIYGRLRWKLGWVLWDGSIKIMNDDVEQNVPGQQRTLLAGEVHMAEALEDTLYIEWLDGDFEKTFVPELRKIVEEKMNV